MTSKNHDRTMIILAKGRERYILLFGDSDSDRAGAIRAIVDWALNPNLSFTWSDAIVLNRRIREKTPDVVMGGRFSAIR